MIRPLYTAALAAGLALTAPAYAVRAVRRGSGLGLRERLGDLSAIRARFQGRPTLWVHAVSVGEVNASIPLLRAIKTRFPDLAVLVSTVTATGRRTVLERVPHADATAYFPLDVPIAVRRALDAVRPGVFCAVETELWPNFLWELSRRGIPSFLVNARLTERSARRYGWGRPLFGPLLAGLMGVAAQTVADAKRFREIGADPNRILIAGNLKFDQGEPDEKTAIRKSDLGVADAERLWVAGSTHPGEEAQILEAYRRVKDLHPEVVLLMAPRHLERLQQVEAAIWESGCDPIRRSAADRAEGGDGTRPPVVLLDTLGELAAVYGAASVAFVGGTLAPIGGHNLLEPAAHGVPVLFGPHTFKCEEIASALLEAGGGVRVDSADTLADEVNRLLGDATLSRRMGERGRTMLGRNRGAVDRTLGMLEPWLSDLLEPR